jgi:adenosylmethionine-8-amino-7-oxononanoate aminotransferase
MDDLLSPRPVPWTTCCPHDLCRYIADEVMVGFARTGKMWGFQHYEGLVPDIVTSAKGLSGAYLPLAMVAMSSELQAFFKDNPIGWGSTYQSHPVALACAYECVKHMLKDDILGNVQRLEPVRAPSGPEMRRWDCTPAVAPTAYSRCAGAC